MTRDGICAGFIVKNGEYVDIAPILRRKFNWWAQFAERI